MTTMTPCRDTETVRFPDGSTIDLRPLGIRDGRLISNFVDQLSPEAEYRRFLSNGSDTRSRWVANLINADQGDSLVFGAVAVNRFGSSLVAIAESISDPGDSQRAEFAQAVVDRWQNKGIGTLLTRHVARIARSKGVRHWQVYLLAENTQMARALSHVGTVVDHKTDSGLATRVYELVDV